MLLDAESALVEQTSRQVEESPRRGPLRPEQLLSVRQRHSRRLAGHQFRAADTVVMAIATAAFVARGIDGALWAIALADLLPVLAAAWVTWWLLRSMGLYRLGRSEAYLSHIARVVAATTAGALAGAGLHVVLPTDRLPIDDLAVAVASGGAGLVVLHTVWFGLVARWRRQGWLTPNLVVVGATAHAEDLIGTAIGWGGNPPSAAIYRGVFPKENDGATVYRLRVRDVPVDGFWSISVYDPQGFFQKNELDRYSLNNLTARQELDGSYTVRFGGCGPDTANCLPIMPGWNYTVRLYRPRAQILSGGWQFPEAQPVR